jgi:hypothetical protein
MGKNPAVGMVLGVAAIGFAVFSMATRTETPPAGYEILDYGILALGLLGFSGSLVAYVKKK